jgi:hypothetical protein
LWNDHNNWQPNQRRASTTVREVSGAAMPITLMNVPMSTTLLSNGLGILLLLWYLIPRTYFQR